MSSRYLNALDAQKAANKALLLAVVLLALLCGIAMWGWNHAPRDLTMHVPPDLRNGAHVKLGEVPPPNVYAFAFYIWQQVNRWAQDGDKDYGLAIFKMAPYLTPRCRETLEQDMRSKASAGELSLRVRALLEIPGHGYEESRVIAQGNGTWRVLLDTEVVETVRGVPVKSAYVRYPLRIVQFDGDRGANPFGLAVDCFADRETPSRIELKTAQPVGPTAPADAGPVKSTAIRN